MSSYMKDNFDYLGIYAVQRKELIKEVLAVQKVTLQELQEVVTDLWQRSEREYQYAALDISYKLCKRMDADWIPFWEMILLQKSWWDSVDGIASNCLGGSMSKLNIAEQREHAERWASHESMWLNRTAIIFQLKYRDKINSELLFDMILSHVDSKEFFIRKAAGWALRELSKTQAPVARQFITDYKDVLSNLTIREASKYLKS